MEGDETEKKKKGKGKKRKKEEGAADPFVCQEIEKRTTNPQPTNQPTNKLTVLMLLFLDIHVVVSLTQHKCRLSMHHQRESLM